MPVFLLEYQLVDSVATRCRHGTSSCNAACRMTRAWIESDCIRADMKLEQDEEDMQQDVAENFHKNDFNWTHKGC